MPEPLGRPRLPTLDSFAILCASRSGTNQKEPTRLALGIMPLEISCRMRRDVTPAMSAACEIEMYPSIVDIVVTMA